MSFFRQQLLLFAAAPAMATLSLMTLYFSYRINETTVLSMGLLGMRCLGFLFFTGICLLFLYLLATGFNPHH